MEQTTIVSDCNTLFMLNLGKHINVRNLRTGSRGYKCQIQKEIKSNHGQENKIYVFQPMWATPTVSAFVSLREQRIQIISGVSYTPIC